jgi:hypothetical protein
MRLRHTLVAAVAAAVPLTGADAAPATLVKGDRISIESRGSDDARRTFTLTYRSGVVGSRDVGSSVRVVETRRVDVISSGARRRELSGTEMLEGRQGTLILRWSIEQVERKGRWGDVAGRWLVIGTRGAYLGRAGHGELSADRRFRITTYRGLLITAW